MNRIRRSFLGGAALTILVPMFAGCAASSPVVRAGGANATEAASVSGYLSREELIDGRAIVPPPPAPGTAAQAADDEAYRNSRRFFATSRWDLAAHDAEYHFPKAVESFACALGIAINDKVTPNLYTLLRRSFVDAGLAGAKAKAPYKRPRPFVAANDPICTPELAAAFRKDTSYPSSNAATGWAWALILSEIAPDRVNAIMARGYAYSQSRVVCGAHWQSDVAAGRLIGSVVVAELHAKDEFVAQLGAARREVAALRTAGTAAPEGCASEAEALAK